MTIALILLVVFVLVSVGIVIGVHNANSSTIKPLALKAQKLGSKAISSAKKKVR